MSEAMAVEWHRIRTSAVLEICCSFVPENPDDRSKGTGSLELMMANGTSHLVKYITDISHREFYEIYVQVSNDISKKEWYLFATLEDEETPTQYGFLFDENVIDQ